MTWKKLQVKLHLRQHLAQKLYVLAKCSALLPRNVAVAISSPQRVFGRPRLVSTHLAIAARVILASLDMPIYGNVLVLAYSSDTHI